MKLTRRLDALFDNAPKPHQDGGWVETARCMTSYAPVEGYDLMNGNWNPHTETGLEFASADQVLQPNLDLSWMDYASQVHHVSPTIKDYVIAPVDIVISDLPNRNGVAIPLETLTEWNVPGGCLGFQTWNRKPLNVEHRFHDPKGAVGLVFDTVLRPRPEFQGDLSSVTALVGVDRNKAPQLAQAVLEGKSKNYSFGTRSGDYDCSICLARWTTMKSKGMRGCDHLSIAPDTSKPSFTLFNGNQMAYRRILNMHGIEISSVAIPAVATAISPGVI